MTISYEVLCRAWSDGLCVCAGGRFKKAEARLKLQGSADNLFLLSTASSEGIGSYAQLVGHGEESLT